VEKSYPRVRIRMKRNKTAPSGSAEDCFVSKWIIYEDRPVKRNGIEDKVSNGDTSRSSSEGSGDKVYTPWLL
jgi:hypothetical protein